MGKTTIKEFIPDLLISYKLGYGVLNFRLAKTYLYYLQTGLKVPPDAQNKSSLSC